MVHLLQEGLGSGWATGAARSNQPSPAYLLREACPAAVHGLGLRHDKGGSWGARGTWTQGWGFACVCRQGACIEGWRRVKEEKGPGWVAGGWLPFPHCGLAPRGEPENSVFGPGFQSAAKLYLASRETEWISLTLISAVTAVFEGVGHGAS